MGKRARPSGGAVRLATASRSRRTAHRTLSFAKTPSGGKWAIYQPDHATVRIFVSGADRRSPCLQDVAHETIPRSLAGSASVHADLPPNARWEGSGTPPARLNSTPVHLSAWQCRAAGGRVKGGRSGSPDRDADAPHRPESPAQPRIPATRGDRGRDRSLGPARGAAPAEWQPREDLAGRGGRTRGVGARGDAATPES